MPRIRSLKPELFVSPQVMNLSRDARLLFIGLITQADDDGRGTSDPRKLKAAIFPGDDDVISTRVRDWLAEIAGQGLVILYDGNGHGPLYALPSFKEHQYIQHAKKSLYPPPPRRASGLATVSLSSQDDHGTGGLDRIGSEGSEGSEGSDRIPTRARATPPEFTDEQLQFARIRAVYPEFTGRQDWLNAEHHCHARIEQDGLSWDDLHAAAERYATFCAAGGVSGPQYVLTPAKFFGAPDKPWQQPWTQPPNKADRRLAGNVAAAAEAERRIFGEAK